MNNITKERISLKLKKALKEEEITQKHASEILGLKSIFYPSMIISGRPNQWEKVSKSAWEQVKGWVNSGETLKNYSLLTKQEKEAFNESQEQQGETTKIEPELLHNEPEKPKKAAPKKEKPLPKKATGEDPMVIFLNNMKKMGYKVTVTINN